jgi:hypothetical protein
MQLAQWGAINTVFDDRSSPLATGDQSFLLDLAFPCPLRRGRHFRVRHELHPVDQVGCRLSRVFPQTVPCGCGAGVRVAH